MKTEAKELKLRLELGLDRALTEAAKKAGIPKTKLAMQLLSQGLLGSPSVVDVNSDRIAGAEAERILFKSDIIWLSTGEKVSWFDGYLWVVGKSANGYQAVLSRLMEYPEVLAKGLGAVYDQQSKKQVIKALANWNELKALDGLELVDRDFFDDGKDFFTCCTYRHTFSDLKDRAIKAIAAAKVALVEPTAAIKVVNKEIAIEVANDAPTPTIELPIEATPQAEVTQLSLLELHQKLDKAQFKAKFKLSDAEYASVGRVGASGWTAEDGTTWFASGTAKNRAWVSSPVALVETEVKVLSAV